MSMGIGINTQKPDEGKLKGELEAVACGVWFTSKGRILPKLVKYQDKEGCLHTISQIRVITTEKKYYCGIPLQEYRCSTILNGREYYFRLYYYPEENCWKICWKTLVNSAL